MPSRSRPHPCGSWPSPLSAAAAVAAGIGVAENSIDGERLLWLESRPAEKGRNVVVQRDGNGTLRDLTPAPYNARNKVHEYGGGAYRMAQGVLYFSHFKDQRLYRVDPGLAAAADHARWPDCATPIFASMAPAACCGACAKTTATSPPQASRATASSPCEHKAMTKAARSSSAAATSMPRRASAPTARSWPG